MELALQRRAQGGSFAIGRALAATRPFLELLLWAALGGLTIGLLLYPVKPTVEYEPIQSLSSLGSLAQFGALFYAWLLSLFLLFVLRRESTGAQVVLVSLFVLGSSGLWIIAGWGANREAPLYAAQMEYIKQSHHFALDLVNFEYFAFPGLFVLGANLSQVTGLSTWDTVVALLLLENVLFAVLFYLIFLRASGSTALAWLGVLLLVQGNMITTKLLQQFHPGSIALLLFAMFLVLLARTTRAGRDLWGSRLLMIVLLTATTVTHFVTSTTFFMVLAGVALVQWKARQNHPALLGIMLPVLLPLTWELYYAVDIFGDLTKLLPKIREDLSSGELLTPYLFDLGGSYAGGANPLWTSVVRYLWVAVVVGFGSIVLLRNSIRVRSLHSREIMALGGIVGMAFLALVTFTLDKGVTSVRIMVYAPAFTIMALLVWISGLGEGTRRYALAGLASLIFLLALPSFLVNNDTVGITIYYTDERAGGEFLRSSYGRGENLQLFGQKYPWVYYVPEASILHIPDVAFFGSGSEPLFWEKVLGRHLAAFKGTGAGGDRDVSPRIWALTQRTPVELRQHLGVDVRSRSQWQTLLSSLEQSDRIYDNGGTYLYYADQ